MDYPPVMRRYAALFIVKLKQLLIKQSSDDLRLFDIHVWMHHVETYNKVAKMKQVCF